MTPTRVESRPRRAAACALLAAAAFLANPFTAAPAAGPETAGDPAFPPHLVPRSQIRSLPRSANGRDYELYVALPASYDAEPAKRYPVVYLCDGYWDFTLLCGLYGNLIYDQAVPEFIIVGFGYQGTAPDFAALRMYDYTPAIDPDYGYGGDRSGHAAEFLAVVEREIIPFVEREYRVDSGRRVLGGSSAGGLFALYTLLTRPALFQVYLAISPGVNWGNDWLLRYEEAFAQAHGELPARLFLTEAGDEWPELRGPIQRLHDHLEQHAYRGLAIAWKTIEGERHAGTKAEGYNRGIRFAFSPPPPRPPWPLVRVAPEHWPEEIRAGQRLPRSDLRQ